MTSAWRPITASLAALSLTASGCSYAITFDASEWTPDRAKSVIRAAELDRLARLPRTELTEKNIVVDDDSFTLLTATSTNARSYRYRLERVLFRNVLSVQCEWNPKGPFFPLASFLIQGPYIYNLRMKWMRASLMEPKPGEAPTKARVATYLHTLKVDQWAGASLPLPYAGTSVLNYFPMWLIPVRPFVRGDEYAEAILYMANRAKKNTHEE